MSLREQINNDIKDALRSKNDLKLQALRMTRAEILKLEKDGRRSQEISDEEVVRVLMSMIKQRGDSAEAFRKGGREELAEKEEQEIEILKSYLPAGPSSEEIDTALREALEKIPEPGPRDLKRIAGQAMGKLKQTGKPVDFAEVESRARKLIGA